MKRYLALIVLTLASLMTAVGQQGIPRSQTVAQVQEEFQSALSSKGQATAFLEFLADDAIVFQPDAVNGKQYWSRLKNEPDGSLKRMMLYLDMSSNGMVGYTTGIWEWTPKGKVRPIERGRFVTVWAKRTGGLFRAVVDVTTAEDGDIQTENNAFLPNEVEGDPNKRGWSAADPSMNFLRAAMGGNRLGGAYSIYAADEIRLIREGEPPIVGKKRVVAETQDYRSISYPKRVVLNESADLAYVWNPCEYSDSDEGIERGNCVHIWKLRGKRWYITLGVLSRVRNKHKPELKHKLKQAVNQ